MRVFLWINSESPPLKTRLIANAIWGVVSFPNYSISVVHANDYAESGDFVMVSSGIMLMYGTGAIASPFIGPMFIQWFGSGGTFLPVAIADFALMLYLLAPVVR